VPHSKGFAAPLAQSDRAAEAAGPRRRAPARAEAPADEAKEPAAAAFALARHTTLVLGHASAARIGAVRRGAVPRLEAAAAPEAPSPRAHEVACTEALDGLALPGIEKIAAENSADLFAGFRRAVVHAVVAPDAGFGAARPGLERPGSVAALLGHLERKTSQIHPRGVFYDLRSRPTHGWVMDEDFLPGHFMPGSMETTRRSVPCSASSGWRS
jgi:hypothetical protein